MPFPIQSSDHVGFLFCDVLHITTIFSYEFIGYW